MARLTITAAARSDLREIRDQISKDDADAAVRVIKRLRDRARLLAESPRMGRQRGGDLRSGLRSFPVGSYVLFYRPRSDGIVLIRVLHGARDLPALFQAPDSS